MDRKRRNNMKRVYNFAAGPAALPEEVLLKAQEELLDFNGCGMSVMEISHRSSEFLSVLDHTESMLRELMGISDDYSVLFLQGGASMQFPMTAMNLMHDKKTAYYINSGNFAKKAAKEAELFGKVIVAASSEADGYTHLPKVTEDMFSEPADYLYFTYNNTIFGTEYHDVPPCPKDMVVVSDMTSCILSEPIDVSKYGLIFAGSQKNIAPSGLAVVIIRKDLLGLVKGLPSMLDYSVMAKNNSLYNTPPTFDIYMAGLMMDWLKSKGGVEGINKLNKEKARILYDKIDSSDFYKGRVTAKEDRSIMSVTFSTGDEEKDKLFCSEAAKEGIANIKGHRIAGGMRASIYNPVSLEAVKALKEFMDRFEEKNS
jgi:phosphoserine aminotransferase